MLFSGSPSRTRTYNLVVNSHPLCRLSYRGVYLTLQSKIFSMLWGESQFVSAQLFRIRNVLSKPFHIFQTEYIHKNTAVPF